MVALPSYPSLPWSSHWAALPMVGWDVGAVLTGMVAQQHPGPGGGAASVGLCSCLLSNNRC